MNAENIRKAEAKDLSRIAEILVFAKRIKYRPIFNNDDYSFNELQVVKLVEAYGKYVDYFFWSQGIGAKLIEFAKETHDARFLWVLEKNVDAIKFYEAHGFAANGKRQPEEGTPEYIIMLERVL